MSTNVAPFQTSPRLTQIAMAIRPEGLIADTVCPRVPVESEKFIYSKFTYDDAFTIPDTKVGRKSEPNTVEFGAVNITDSTEDYGLDDFVPNKDLQTARSSGANFDPLGTAAEGIATLVALAREQRVANLYFTAANYAAGLQSTLSGTTQWSDATNSDPVKAIMDAIDSMLVRPNTLVLGRAVWTALRRHPKVIAAILGRTGAGAALTAAGVASRQAVQDLLEIENIQVGESFYNSAKKGQTASYSRLWGKHAALLRIDTNIRSTVGMAMPTFAMTAQYGDKVAGTIPEPKRGLRGGQTVRVGEQVKEIITFQEAGYFFQNAIA